MAKLLGRFESTLDGKNIKNDAAKANFSLFPIHFTVFFVPLHPLFGVIAGRKHRVACYVALERYNNQLIT